MIRLLLLLTLAPLVSAQPAAPPPAGTAPAEQILLPPEPGRFAGLFRLFRTERAALSPDGRHLAYSVREGEDLFVVTLDLDHPAQLKARVKVVDDRAATPMLARNQRERTPGRILWLGWVTPDRLVVETNAVHTQPVSADGDWASWSGAILAFDADGGNARQLASPADLPEFAQDPGGANPFSPARPRGFAALAGAPTPDQPAESVDAGIEVEAGVALPPEEDPDAAPVPPTDTGSMQPRSLHVFAFDPERAGAIRLVAQGAARGNGLRSLGFYSLDPRNGRLTNLADELVPVTRRTLVDRQGRARIEVPGTVLTDFPFRFEYRGTHGLRRSRPLDEAAGQAGFSVSPANYFGERAIPLGFDENPDVLYFASNLGRDTYGLYSLNLATGQRGSVTLENPAYDLIGPPGAGFPDPHTLVFDRFTHQLTGVRFQAHHRTAAWFRPGWQAVQAELEASLPGRSVELLEWDEAGRRFLVATEGPADPGAFYVFDRDTKQLREFVRRAPWVETNHAHTTIPFGFGLADGARLTGFITVPAQPRMKPVPLLVLCPDEPWARVTPDFQRDVHALAGMGFAVVQYNGRGAWGLGRKQREAITAGYDLVQVEDLATLVAALGQRFQINPQRVALLGRGHGGFIALRAIQARPELFRCAIALEPPVDLAGWLANLRWTDDDVAPHLTRAWLGDEARLRAAPLTREPGKIAKPILVLSHPGPDGSPRRPVYLAARRFAEAVAGHGVTAEFADLPTDYVAGLPAARARVFDRLEAFLNEHIYDYKVKLSPLQILPDRKP